MPGIHEVFKDEDVAGQIVGGFKTVAALFYEGRRQSRNIYADSDGEAISRLEGLRAELLSENPHVFNTSGWEVRIF